MQETIDQESLTTPGDDDIYEPMANASQNFVTKFSLQDDIYMSMMQLNPEMQLCKLNTALYNVWH